MDSTTRLLICTIILLIIWAYIHRTDPPIPYSPAPPSGDFDVDHYDDFLVLSRDGEPFMHLKKTELYNYLDKCERTGWVSDYHDPSQGDGHGQMTGKYTFDEYFDNIFGEELKYDIRLYMDSLTKHKQYGKSKVS